MDDDIIDVTSSTSGRHAFVGTVRFTAEGEQYGLRRWRIRADDEQAVEKALAALSENSIYADPRIDHLREYEVEEDCEILEDDAPGA